VGILFLGILFWGFFKDSPKIFQRFFQGFFRYSLRILFWGFFNDSPKVLQGFFKDSPKIPQRFFKNSSGILWR